MKSFLFALCLLITGGLEMRALACVSDHPEQSTGVLGFGESIRSGVATHYGVSPVTVTVVKLADRLYSFSTSGGQSGTVAVVLEGGTNRAYATALSGSFNFIVEDDLEGF